MNSCISPGDFPLGGRRKVVMRQALLAFCKLSSFLELFSRFCFELVKGYGRFKCVYALNSESIIKLMSYCV